MRLITLLDTSISSDNLGDEIIMDAVKSELYSCIKDAYFYTVATHDSMGRTARKILRNTEFSIVGGTNFLSSTLLRGSGWKISPQDIGSLRNAIMMGVGWRDYQNNASYYAKFMYKRVISSEALHSCRDQYSAQKLKSLGFNVVNTSCPTLWKMTPDRCAKIPVKKAGSVVTALTFYRPDPDVDREMLRLLQDSYSRVYFWIQQAEDLSYLKSLGNFDVVTISPNIVAYNELLESEDIDFVGSRLHGGIRALQKGRRSLIVSVDNRAAEIGRDTGLPVVARADIQTMRDWIITPRSTTIRLPLDQIGQWKSQFLQM